MKFLHALGLLHEQSRPDRDEYVIVHLENIEVGATNNFRKVLPSSTLGKPYDYGSVMHYPTNAFSANGKETITPIQPLEGKIVGQRNEASDRDILDIQLLYQCMSGPRTLDQYYSYHCSSDCKCWLGEVGCRNNNNACQGDLICQKDVCVNVQRKRKRNR